MTQLSLIAAITNNLVIGDNNTLPWRIKDDMKHFKTITSGKTVVMGRKTFESIGRALPDRRNIVLTRDINWSHEDVEVAHNMEDIMELCLHEKEAVIIGGGELYRTFLPYCNHLHLTIIDAHIKGDATFPPFNPDDFKTQHIADIVKNDDNQYNCKILLLTKIDTSIDQ